MKKDWKNPQEEKPRRKKWFDMCLLDLGNRIVKGWWTGSSWDGLHYDGETVRRWKYIGNDGFTLG